VVSRLSKLIKLAWFHYKDREGILVKKKDKVDNLLNFLFGMLIGGAGYAILSSILKPHCPVCKNKIDRFTPECPTCHSKLRWR
jgi:hypothetical protein